MLGQDNSNLLTAVGGRIVGIVERLPHPPPPQAVQLLDKRPPPPAAPRISQPPHPNFSHPNGGIKSSPPILCAQEPKCGGGAIAIVGCRPLSKSDQFCEIIDFLIDHNGRLKCCGHSLPP